MARTSLLRPRRPRSTRILRPQLRSYFQNRAAAQPPNQAITVGTLFHIARQYGADFNRWKEIADGSDAAVAVYRRATRRYAESFSTRLWLPIRERSHWAIRPGPLGDSFACQNKNALPPNTRWEGDLTGTTLATPADIMQRAERLKWNAIENNRLVRAHPPRAFIHDYLPQMRGQYAAAPFDGHRARATYRPITARFTSFRGYDPHTGLFHDRSPTFDVPAAPSQDDARSAAKALLLPFKHFQFDDPTVGGQSYLSRFLQRSNDHFCRSLRCSSFVVRCLVPARVSP